MADYQTAAELAVRYLRRLADPSMMTDTAGMDARREGGAEMRTRIQLARKALAETERLLGEGASEL